MTLNNNQPNPNENHPNPHHSTMEKGEGPRLPEGPQRRNGVTPFQRAPPASTAAPLHTPAPPHGPQRRNGVIPFQMAPPASAAAPLNPPPAHPKGQKRPGTPFPGATPRSAGSAAPGKTTVPPPKKRLGGPFPGVTLGNAAPAAPVNTSEPAPKKRLGGLFPGVTVGAAPLQGGPSPNPTSDNEGPPHGITPLVGPATAQTPSFGSSTIRNQRPNSPRRSETGPSEAVSSSNVPANPGHQFQELREISELSNELADAEGTRVVFAAEDVRRLHRPVETARHHNPEDIANLSAQFDVLEARYEEAKRALKEAAGDAVALDGWRGKYEGDGDAWVALTDLVEEVDDNNLYQRYRDAQAHLDELLDQQVDLLGMEFLKRRQKHGRRAMPRKVATRSAPRGSRSIKRLENAIDVRPKCQPQAGQDNGEGPSSGESEASKTASNGELNPPTNDSNGAMIPAPVTASASSDATPLASGESLEAGSLLDAFEAICGALQSLEITPSVPSPVEEHDAMANPAEGQIAESCQPQDGSQSGEDLAQHDGYMEWLGPEEYLSIPQGAMSAPAVQQPSQAPVEIEYYLPSHSKAEKRMGPVAPWTERKKQITRATVVKAGSGLLARIDNIQPSAPTGCVGQVAEDTVRKTESELLARDESIPAQPVQAVHAPVPAPPVSQVHTPSVETEEAPTLEVGSQSAVPQPAPIVPEPSAQVPLEAAMSEPAVPQPALAKKVRFAALPTEATVSEPAGSQWLQTVLAAKAKVATDGVVSELAASQQAPTASEPSSRTVTSAVAQPTPVVPDGTEKVAVQAVVSEPALSQQAPAALKPSPSGEDDSAWSDSDDDEWWPALQWQATSESDLADEEWWPALERQAP
ncbi:uncharacterized protein N7515_000688 [Penicillium bovifimosum]|uniref:Uncharacterized protein n=1 Tax=Penicillium bovifimosum TaxID=126998 RepID=A0A9W9LA45_9EURO|nr:uncharacterized protein N7515_000688 [Penicillium bovifimosum]KAJ5146124.1 hypothetical protein N7515_000688 [Penicillium bovifimosum]